MRSGVEPAPKDPLTIETWKRLAGPMEAHLEFRGVDIADWHLGTRLPDGRLKLSSRKLLVLCEHIPEVGGRWSMAMKIAKETHKEVALHRASLYVGGPNEYAPQLFLDPDEAREMTEKAEAEEADFDAATDELYDDLDFT